MRLETALRTTSKITSGAEACFKRGENGIIYSKHSSSHYDKSWVDHFIFKALSKLDVHVLMNQNKL